MPKTRVAINGFGRIGRLVLRSILEEERDLEVVAVNDLAPPDERGYLYGHDSVHGKPRGDVRVEDHTLSVDGARIRLLQEKEPARLPWRELRVDHVVDATGRFRTRAALQGHLDAGAKRVLLTAPGKDIDVSLVRGVNLDAYDPQKHKLVSNSSCTTNCLAPVLKVLDDSFGVEQAVVTTVHAYTNGQRLLDANAKDPRRSRAAPINIIPTTTGAAEAIGDVLPNLRGKVKGMAVRVPVPNVSLIDLNAKLSERVTEAGLKDAFQDAADGPMEGVLGVETRPLVSSDYNHDPRSAIVDVPSLMVVDGSFVKVLAWYDNEWAYAVRTADVLAHIAELDKKRATPTTPA